MARDYDYTFHFINGKYAKNFINGEAERTADLMHEQLYSQNDIINGLFREVNAKNLNKGVRVNNSSNNFFSCHFSYDIPLANNEKFNKKYTIIIPNDLVRKYPEIQENINKLTSLLNSTLSIQLQNERALKNKRLKLKKEKIKTTIGVVITAAGIVGTMLALDKAYEWEQQYNANLQQEYVDKTNERRAKNDLPPIDLTDENGYPYNSWEEYYADKKEENTVNETKEIVDNSLLQQAYEDIENEIQNQR